MKKSNGDDDRLDAYRQRAKEKLGCQKAAFEALPSAPTAHGHRSHSIRRVEHNGREIVIRTHYEILVDGEPLPLHVSVNDRGRVHCHGLPNYAFPSAVDMVKQLLDADRSADVRDELAHIYEGH